MNKKALTEADIRTKFITPALVGPDGDKWNVMTQIREEAFFTNGRVIVRGKTVKRGEAKKADYLLFYKPNLPILPWGTHVAERLNVRNGLCLSRLHDAAFDQRFITFDDNLRMVLSPQLKSHLSQRAIAENFGAYEGMALCLPEDAVLPELAFLAEHRTKLFRAA